ncbi:hypothetical protein C5167_044338 [Papaver somniferum]|uniref:Uncharacterized protein n=1 Tax=Papaver somniferum TaxID=3469 RepID=A0A4Y7LBT5_PAPSO|nr:hypothetical protein C5167_044338 [Papaver somniferum]
MLGRLMALVFICGCLWIAALEVAAAMAIQTAWTQAVMEPGKRFIDGAVDMGMAECREGDVRESEEYNKLTSTNTYSHPIYEKIRDGKKIKR